MKLPPLFNPPFANANMTLYAMQLGQTQMTPSKQHEAIARSEIRLRSHDQPAQQTPQHPLRRSLGLQ
jgi:hypothetical protein